MEANSSTWENSNYEGAMSIPLTVSNNSSGYLGLKHTVIICTIQLSLIPILLFYYTLPVQEVKSILNIPTVVC